MLNRTEAAKSVLSSCYHLVVCATLCFANPERIRASLTAGAFRRPGTVEVLAFNCKAASKQ